MPRATNPEQDQSGQPILMKYAVPARPRPGPRSEAMMRLIGALGLMALLAGCFPNIPSEHWAAVRAEMPRPVFPIASGVYQVLEDGADSLLEESDVFVLRREGNRRQGQYRFSHTDMYVYPFDDTYVLVEFEQGGVFADDDTTKKLSLILLGQIESEDRFTIFPVLCRDLPDDMLAGFGTDKDECSFRNAADLKAAFDALKEQVDAERGAVFQRLYPLPDKAD